MFVGSAMRMICSVYEFVYAIALLFLLILLIFRHICDMLFTGRSLDIFLDVFATVWYRAWIHKASGNGSLALCVCLAYSHSLNSHIDLDRVKQ